MVASSQPYLHAIKTTPRVVKYNLDRQISIDKEPYYERQKKDWISAANSASSDNPGSLWRCAWFERLSCLNLQECKEEVARKTTEEKILECVSTPMQCNGDEIAKNEIICGTLISQVSDESGARHAKECVANNGSLTCKFFFGSCSIIKMRPRQCAIFKQIREVEDSMKTELDANKLVEKMEHACTTKDSAQCLVATSIVINPERKDIVDLMIASCERKLATVCDKLKTAVLKDHKDELIKRFSEKCTSDEEKSGDVCKTIIELCEKEPSIGECSKIMKNTELDTFLKSDNFTVKTVTDMGAKYCVEDSASCKKIANALALSKMTTVEKSEVTKNVCSEEKACKVFMKIFAVNNVDEVYSVMCDVEDGDMVEEECTWFVEACASKTGTCRLVMEDSEFVANIKKVTKKNVAGSVKTVLSFCTENSKTTNCQRMVALAIKSKRIGAALAKKACAVNEDFCTETYNRLYSVHEDLLAVDYYGKCNETKIEAACAIIDEYCKDPKKPACLPVHAEQCQEASANGTMEACETYAPTYCNEQRNISECNAFYAPMAESDFHRNKMGYTCEEAISDNTTLKEQCKAYIRTDVSIDNGKLAAELLKKQCTTDEDMNTKDICAVIMSACSTPNRHPISDEVCVALSKPACRRDPKICVNLLAPKCEQNETAACKELIHAGMEIKEHVPILADLLCGNLTSHTPHPAACMEALVRIEEMETLNEIFDKSCQKYTFELGTCSMVRKYCEKDVVKDRPQCYSIGLKMVNINLSRGPICNATYDMECHETINEMCTDGGEKKDADKCQVLMDKLNPNVTYGFWEANCYYSNGSAAFCDTARKMVYERKLLLLLRRRACLWHGRQMNMYTWRCRQVRIMCQWLWMNQYPKGSKADCDKVMDYFVKMNWCAFAMMVGAFALFLWVWIWENTDIGPLFDDYDPILQAFMDKWEARWIKLMVKLRIKKPARVIPPPPTPPEALRARARATESRENQLFVA